MSKQEAETKRVKTADASGDRTNLDRQYRRIGISAVAAALPYAGKAKNSASASDERDRHSRDRKRSVLSV
jgi:hypothetical protein